jgi:hypothetical protein
VSLLLLCKLTELTISFLFVSDLLEHEDLTVGVMASQILTEIHAIDALKLENCIQNCPAGTLCCHHFREILLPILILGTYLALTHGDRND